MDRIKKGGERRLSWWSHGVVLVAFGCLAGAVLAAKSVAPAVLGRYSKGLFVYQLFNVAVLACLVAPARKARTRWIGYGLVVVSTFIAPENEAVRQWQGRQAVLPILRLLTAWAVVAAEFDRFRAGKKQVRGVALGVAVALGSLSMLDLAIYARVATTVGFDEDHEGYRDRYDLGSITADDVVIAGDSFVWGHGVSKAQRFGNVLKRLYGREGRRVRVFSLGVRGAGPERYVESLSRVPEDRKLGVAVFSFYPNDLAPRPKSRSKLLSRLEGPTWALGQSSLTFRVLHDALGKIESPSLDRYHASLIDDFRPDDPSYPQRWAELSRSLENFARLARRRSSSRPLLLIIPLMVDFPAYPLTQGHVALRNTAETLGFDVLDLLPAFRAALGDGGRYRVVPGDNHFDARVHELVARLLKERLDARADTAALGRAETAQPSR